MYNKKAALKTVINLNYCDTYVALPAPSENGATTAKIGQLLMILSPLFLAECVIIYTSRGDVKSRNSTLEKSLWLALLTITRIKIIQCE